MSPMLILPTFLAAVLIFGALYVSAGAVFYGASRLFDWVAGSIRDAWATRGRHTPR